MLLIDHQVGTMLFGIQDIDPVNLMNNTLMLAEGAKIFLTMAGSGVDHQCAAFPVDEGVKFRRETPDAAQFHDQRF